MIQRLSPEESAARLGGGAKLVDVRAPEEFADGHPDRAVNVPLTRFVEGRLVDDDTFVARMREAYGASTPIAILCRSGVRAERAATLLEAAGYTDLVVVRGGYEGTRGPFGEVLEPGWRRAGLR